MAHEERKYFDIVRRISNLFQNIMEEETLYTIVESCNGDMNQAMDIVMSITGENNISQNNMQEIIPTSSVSNPVNATKLSADNCCKDLKCDMHQICEIVEGHKNGNKILVIMRGLPGSGKSFLAKQILSRTVGNMVDNHRSTHIFSTDDYFTKRGVYHFNKFDLGEAHMWNQNRARDAMIHGLTPVVIDNTNISLWEMEPYVKYGITCGYHIEVVEVKTPWAKKAQQLAKRNVHNVPFEKIKRMLNNYVTGITGDYLINYFGLSHLVNRVSTVQEMNPSSITLGTSDDGIILTNDNALEPSFSESVSNEKKDEVDNTRNVPSDSALIELESDDTRNSQSKEGIFFYNETKSLFNETNVYHTTQQLDVGHMEIFSSDSSQRPAVASCSHDENKSCSEETKKSSNKLGEDTNENKIVHDGRFNMYQEIQNQFQEIAKIEDEWEKGEKWDENATNIDSSNTSNVDIDPKPRRKNRDNSTFSDFLNTVAKCEDWTQISMDLPPRTKDVSSQLRNMVIHPTTKTSGTCMEPGDKDANNLNSKVLVATPRDINLFYTPCKVERISQKLTFDKSAMTNEVDINIHQRCEHEEKHFIAFRRLFKNVPRNILKDIFDNCCGDVNWAVNIVVDGIADNMLKFDVAELESEDILDNEEEVAVDNCNCLSQYQIIPDMSLKTKWISSMNEIPKFVPKSVIQKNMNNKTKLSPNSSEKLYNSSVKKGKSEAILLKRQIEQNIVIPDSFFSNNSLSVKKICERQLSTTSDNGISGSSPIKPQDKPSTSKDNQKAIESSEDESSNSDDDEKIITMEISRKFIKDMDNVLGRSDMKYPGYIIPEISMPLSLLKEINALWIESLMNQLDKHSDETATVLKQDEELARQLASKESELAEAGVKPPEPNFKEIMELDCAISLYQRNINEWRSGEQDNIAAKLSKEKLYNLFPEIPQDTLSELLMAYNNNFQSTVEMLLTSTGRQEILSEDNGVNKFIMSKETERQQKVLEKEKKAFAEKLPPEKPMKVDMTTVRDYRETAEKHLQARNQYIQKAQDYIRRGMTTVATHYSDVANLHRKKYEQASSSAAVSLIQMQSSTNPLTIDLHFLRVAEAQVSLDLYLDEHIRKMRENPAKHRTRKLFIITGRGLHSAGGPRVKPAVKKRLKERYIKHTEKNPGLLSIKVNAFNKLTHELDTNN